MSPSKEEIGKGAEKLNEFIGALNEAIEENPELIANVKELAERYSGILCTFLAPLIEESKKQDLKLSEERFKKMCELYAGAANVAMDDIPKPLISEFVIVAFQR